MYRAYISTSEIIYSIAGLKRRRKCGAMAMQNIPLVHCAVLCISFMKLYLREIIDTLVELPQGFFTNACMRDDRIWVRTWVCEPYMRSYTRLEGNKLQQLTHGPSKGLHFLRLHNTNFGNPTLQNILFMRILIGFRSFSKGLYKKGEGL